MLRYVFVSLYQKINQFMEIKDVITGVIIGSSQIKFEFKSDSLTK